jgi:pimeloyl-ACP methyl ester carboxylesterase
VRGCRVVEPAAPPAPTTVVTLPGGRLIAADDVGDPAGRPVLYLHGAPDCRLARHPDDGVAAGLGIRLVAVDRPGVGGTDPLPLPAGVPVDTRAWADDVAALLDHLGIERCVVAAWSAGCPWAFGLAAGLPDRVAGVLTYGCLAPYEALDDPEVVAASGSRATVAEELASGTSLRELIDGFAAMLLPPPPVDLDVAREVVLEAYSPRARRDVESVPGLVDQLAWSLAATAASQGADGLALDLAVQYDTGGLEVLAGVRCPVVLVHGRFDPVAGPAVGRWLAGRLASARVEEWEAGHQGLLVHWARWLALAATDAR